MAIISIPSSIGGITIPGSLISGPLGALFGNKFGQDTMQYPRDLQSATKGHVVHFTINEVDPITYEETVKTYGNIPGVKTLMGGIENIPNNSTNSGSSSKIFTETGLNFQPRRKKIAANIFMYMPDTMNFSYGANYDTPSALKAGAKVVDAILPGKNSSIGGKMGQKVLNAITSTASGIVGSGALELVGQKIGYAINPQLQMLFQGIGFREFQMAFTFTPYSRQEADQVDKIIKTFRTHAAPRIVTQVDGMFFVPPSSFSVDFLFNGSINPHLNKVMDSVITNIDVNYSPNGWSAHDNGAPVQTTMTIQFKEITLVDRKQIENGY